MMYCFNFAQEADINLLSKKINGTSRKKRDATIPFIFNNEDVIDIINMLAAKKEINIVLPTGANAINFKVTLALPDMVTIQEAWNMLGTLLDIAGYSIVNKNNLYVIVKNSKNIMYEPFPLYINTPVDQLPNTNERIRYIYYLKNIKISSEFNNQVAMLFKDTMPEDATFKPEINSNGLLIIGKSNDIRSFLNILQSLDEIGFQESLEVIRLRYTVANNVSKIFADILKSATPQQPARFNLEARKEQATYFSSNVKVIPEPRTNSLIVLGRTQAVDRVKDFIFKHIDVELDQGKSILHIYELQYLDAAEFAPVLRNIVESTRKGGTEQSRTSGEAQAGIERFFDQVIIQADTPAEATEEQGKYFGGNKLVIAARNDDWKRIKTLIEQLDQPQPQVIIEVLIADLTLDDLRNLGSISRNINDLSFPGSATAQAAMVDQVVLDASTSAGDPNALSGLTGVDSDINAITVLNDATSNGLPLVSIPQNLIAGTTVLSISDKDGRTWSILEILKRFNSTKILSHPHIIAVNNYKAEVRIGEERLVKDQSAPSTSGITVRRKEIPAQTVVYITPRISAANTVNLQIVIEIDQFTSTDLSSGDRVNRNVITNAMVKSGDILALGGLVREITTDAVVQTPILGDIPILGWFFKQKNRDILTTSLTVFISPTIIQPKLRGGIGEYTKSYVEVAKNYNRQSGLFDNLRDPITRWFFKAESEAGVIAADFLEKDQADEPLHEAQAVDLVGEREAKIMDHSLGIAPLDTTAVLKDFLANQENPLKQSAVQDAVAVADDENPRNLSATGT